MKKPLLLIICTTISILTLAQQESQESLIKHAQKVRPDFYLGSESSGLSSSRVDDEQRQLTEFFLWMK